VKPIIRVLALAASVFAFLITVTAPALAEQYLCVPDKATGFAYNKTTNEWDVTRLKTPQFVISPSKTPDTAYDVKDMASEPDLPGGSSCRRDFKEDMLFCDVAWGGTISVNKANGRFVRSFTGAYWNVGIPNLGFMTDENTGTPMIEIGKCTAF
jgi:hypothetical protein